MYFSSLSLSFSLCNNYSYYYCCCCCYKVFTDISKGAKIFSPPFHAKKPFFCSFFFFFFFFICFFTFSPLSLQQTDMEETEETNTRNRKCTAKTSFRQRTNTNTNTNKQPVHNHHHHHHHHHLYHHNQILHHHHHHQSNRIHLGFFNQYQTYPPLLPLPPTIPLNFAANTTTTPPFPQNHNNNNFRSKTHLQKPSRTSSNSQFQHISVAPPGTSLFSSSRIHDFVKRFDFY